jgi:hypothetical protein
LLIHLYKTFASIIEYKRGLDDGQDIGEKIGYNKALKEYGIPIPCGKCGKDNLSLTPNSEWHKLVIDLLQQRGWRHQGCSED